MGVPNLGEFSALLQEDAIFRDYFNLFLNLPVFSTRFVYNAVRKCFQVDTPVQSPYHVVEEPKLAVWIHSNRLPLFWNSDLFCDYQLCSELVQENEVLPPEVRQSLSTVAGLHCFRKFLFAGEGEAACLFWLEVQRLKHATEPWIAAKITSRIQQLYLRDGAPFSLSEVLKEMILLVYTPKKNSPVSSRLKALVKAQAIVMQNLKTYWCKRYVIKLQESLSSCALKETISEICRRETVLVTHKSSPAHLPRIIVDEGKGSDDRETRKLSHLQLSESACKLPLVKSSGSLLSDGSNSYDRDSVELVISPSTQELFTLLVPSKLQTPNPEEHVHDLPFHPYLFASLRADFMAGNPILRHFQRSPKVVNYLLFWQSVENVLTRDEMRRWCHRQAKTNVHPYSAHFETYPIANTPSEVVRLFIKRRAHHKIDLPSDVSNELILLLPKGLGQSLLLSAQDYVAKCLLQPWQDFLLHDYRDFLRNCAVQRRLRRLSSPHRREHSKAVMAVTGFPHLLEQTYGSSRLTGMWTALKLAEAAKYPGVYLLPSRQVMDVSLQRTPSRSDEDNDSCLSDYGDLDLIEQVRVSLHPMVTTVYNRMFRNPQKSIRKILCTTVPAHSTDLHHKKLPPPKTFLEMLKDPEHLELFHYFLQSQGSSAEMQLLFWMAVEDVRGSMGSKRACNSKTRRIQQRFCGGSGADSVLRCHDPAISELSKKDRISPFQLLDAQAAVAETMEKRWFQEYLDFLAAEDCVEEVSEDTPAKKPVCREHTKGLWNMFTLNVISFRRGLMNPSTAELFRNFLQEEVVKASSGSHKKVVGTKVVNVTKLLSDLYFWAEVERYKDLADIVNAAKASGTHTPEDDIMVHKKAHAIINCYIDSAVYPRVQVNVPNEIVQYILDSLSQGLITRGLFHEAALNIFSVLITYWKRFCMARFAPKRKKSLPSGSHGSHSGTTARSSRHSHHSTLSLAHSGRTWPSGMSIFAERTNSQWWDGGPILSFSLSTGLKWLRPTHDNYPIQ